MKNFNKLKIGALSFLIASVISCRNDEDIQNNPNNPSTELEFKQIRILVNDEVTNELNMINPFDNSTKSFQADFAKASLSSTNSNRFGILLSSAANGLQLFDSGISVHGDHTHTVNEIGWAILKGTFNKPSHVSSKFGELSVFNDGLGTFSYTHENTANDPAGSFTTVNIPSASPHHGAMLRFSNGNYAVTSDDNTVPNASSSLPERVKIVDTKGNTVNESTLATTGIHGDETDGENAVFGSYNGALVVNKSGQQYIIPNPQGFTSSDILGSIYYSKESKKFYGRSSKKGIYEINLSTKKITPVLESTDISSVYQDFSTSRLIVLHYSGVVKLINTQSNTIEKEGQVVTGFLATDNSKPVVKATEKFLYVVDPRTTKLKQIRISDLKINNEYNVSAKPYQLTIIGAELDK